MDAASCAIIAVVIIVLIVIVAIIYAAKSRNNVTAQPPTRQPLPPMTMGQGRNAPSWPSPINTPINDQPGMRVIRRRPPPTSDSGIIYTSNFEDPVHIPATVTIYHNQRDCPICKKPIRWSSRSTGWARCLSTKKLVHGHCYQFTRDHHSDTYNWCPICSGSCRSNQAMSIEGI